MEDIVPELRFSAKERLVNQVQRCGDVKLKLRYLIIVNLIRGRTVAEIARRCQDGRFHP